MGDEHHARQPKLPFEPTLRALLAVQATDKGPHVNMRTVEIFTDAEVLSELFKSISNPAKARPFRVDLSVVRNILFIEEVRQHGRGHTDKGGRVKPSMPVWATNAVRKIAFEEPRLPLSGGHYRVVRYRLGDVVCAVRCKVDFVCESRKIPPHDAAFDPLGGIRPETINEEEGGIKTWRTTIRHLGMGTKPDQAGRTTLRFTSDDSTAYFNHLMATELPLLWFSRTSYIADTILTKHMTVIESRLRALRPQHYRPWERVHQIHLQVLVALLHKMKQIARSMGGSCTLICDPVQWKFMIMNPVIKKQCPVPEDIAVHLWGSEEEGAAVQTEYESTTTSESSGLSTPRSRTPSGFADWTLHEDTGTGAVHTQQARRMLASHIIVSQWLDRDQMDGVDSSSDYMDQDSSSFEMETNHICSRRCAILDSEEGEDHLCGHGAAHGGTDVDEHEGGYDHAYGYAENDHKECENEDSGARGGDTEDAEEIECDVEA